jgi:hypothetical protein
LTSKQRPEDDPDVDSAIRNLHALGLEREGARAHAVHQGAGGSERDVGPLLLRHQLDEALHRGRAVLCGEKPDFADRSGQASGIAALPWLVGRSRRLSVAAEARGGSTSCEAPAFKSR